MAATIDTTTAKLTKLSVDNVEIKKLNDVIEGEEVEEILKDNTRRFCLFPIKYHEVIITNMILYSYLTKHYLIYRFGNFIRRLKPLSGLLKKLICPRINMIGKQR